MSHNDRRRQGVWTHWVPLAITVTVATVGIAAWALSQRQEHHDDPEEEPEPHLDYENADYGDNPPYGATTRDGRRGPRPDGNHQQQQSGTEPYDAETSGASWGARMSGALRRTPSPQQFFDSTGRTITAGVAAAGAVMGKALASIREDERYPAESNPWSEEADARKSRSAGAAAPGGKRRTVVIVLSADAQIDAEHDDGSHEHASILSHIPSNINHSKVRLFVLIYAPNLKEGDVDPNSTMTPGSEARSPTLAATTNTAFNAIYSQALSLVEKETMIIPFTTATGYTYILRPLQPDFIYLQQSLGGENGALVSNLQTWFRHDITLVVGADSGSGALADSESEAERAKKTTEWWQRPERVGRGRGVVVVDGMRVHDDWVRRIEGQE